MMEVTMIAAFLAGVLSFFAPCILPLVPIYMGYIAGDNASLQKTIIKTLLFIGGFSLVFTGLGALAGRFGFYAFQRLSWLTLVAGIAVILAGLALLVKAAGNKAGYFSLPFASRIQGAGGGLANKAQFLTQNKRTSWLAPFLMGSALAIAWTPCIGPVLGGVLTLAYARETVVEGTYLLFVYSLGLGLPFLLSALFVQRIRKLQKLQKWNRIIQALSGIFLVIFGIIIASGNLAFINSSLYKYWPF